LDIHGFFDVTFANDYMTPRGLLVTNTGLTTQIVSGLTFSLYKNPDTWINSFSVTVGTFNDLWSQQNHVQVGSWNEFDWWVSADWTIAKYWKTGVTYITFLSPPGNFRQERNVEPYIRFDDGALTGWAFTFNPYVKLFYAISGSSTVVVGNQGDTYDVEIGLVPTLDHRRPADDCGADLGHGRSEQLLEPRRDGLRTGHHYAVLAQQCRRVHDRSRPQGIAGLAGAHKVGQLVRQGWRPVLSHHQR
jgi:hypothetical protein